MFEAARGMRRRGARKQAKLHRSGARIARSFTNDRDKLIMALPESQFAKSSRLRTPVG
jgi:hypothetical protein